MIMAALLRFGAGRACRLLAAYTIRNPSIYQRNSPSFNKEHIFKACVPSVNASRFLSNGNSANKTVESQNAAYEMFAAEIIEGDNSQGVGERSSTSPAAGQYNYERNVRQLGTIVMSKVLHRTFNEILKRGKLNFWWQYFLPFFMWLVRKGFERCLFYTYNQYFY